MLFRNYRIFTITALLFALVATHAGVSSIKAQQASFAFRSIDGQTVSADSLRGKVVVLAFGASWLPLSRSQAQGLQRLSETYRGAGVEVFFVSTESERAQSRNYASDEQLRQFARRNNLRVTVLRDPDGQTSRALGVDQVPAIVLLDRQGNISGAPILGLNPDRDFTTQLSSRLDELL